MQQRQVGRSDLVVSRLGLGTLGWGTVTDPPTARGLLRAYVNAGGNLLDTAPTYGGGLAERMIGSLLRHDVPRERLVIATKAGFKADAEGQPLIDTSKQGLLDDLAGSLRRMGTDYVDLWQLHTWGTAPLDETLAALDQAVAAGMARHVGVCNLVGWQTATAATRAELTGTHRLVSGQNEYSLLARRAEVEVLEALAYHEMGFFPWSPIGRGVLTGKYRHGIPAGSRLETEAFAWFAKPYQQERANAIVDAVERAAGGLGLRPEQVALLWVRDAPGVTAPLLGPRNAAQLLPYLEVDDQELPEEIVAALDDITGGTNERRLGASEATLRLT